MKANQDIALEDSFEHLLLAQTREDGVLNGMRLLMGVAMALSMLAIAVVVLGLLFS
jgi:hypothetical protein